MLPSAIVKGKVKHVMPSAYPDAGEDVRWWVISLLLEVVTEIRSSIAGVTTHLTFGEGVTPGLRPGLSRVLSEQPLHADDI